MDFLFSSLNIIDVLGILPFYISQLLNRLSSQYSLEYIAKAAQIFRILRILRIFKLSRHITGMKPGNPRKLQSDFSVFGQA